MLSKDEQGRALILHMHLFKNAGTTLDWSLERAFGDTFCDHREDAQMRGNPEYLAQYLEQHSSLTALSSHWLPLPLSTPAAIRAHPVAFVRDPIERIASVYAFERQQAVDHPGTRRARDANFEDYVRWRLEGSTGPVMRNYQMRMLSGEYPGSGDEDQLRRALRNIESFPLVGVVEQYARSIVLLEYSLRDHFPDVDLAYRRQNVRDPGDSRSLEERRREVVNGLGSMFEAAVEANRLDQILYEHVQTRLERQWDALDNPTARLADLTRRCDELATR